MSQRTLDLTNHSKPHRRRMNGEEPMVRQNPLNGWLLSWNPDDNRYYVTHPETDDTVATFKDWDNTVYYARRHNP